MGYLPQQNNLVLLAMKYLFFIELCKLVASEIVFFFFSLYIYFFGVIYPIFQNIELYLSQRNNLVLLAIKYLFFIEWYKAGLR